MLAFEGMMRHGVSRAGETEGIIYFYLLRTAGGWGLSFTGGWGRVLKRIKAPSADSCLLPPPPCFSRPIVGTGSGVCVTGGEGDSLTPLQLDGFFACLHSEKILELLVSLSYLDQTLHPWLS